MFEQETESLAEPHKRTATTVEADPSSNHVMVGRRCGLLVFLRGTVRC